jgi:hypothetical protein
MICALNFYLQRPTEVAILGDREDAETQRLHKVVNSTWRSDVVIGGSGEASHCIPLLKDRTQIDGVATAYVCRNSVCSAPVTDAGALEKLLDESLVSH